MSFTIIRWRWVSEPSQTKVESFDNQAQAKRWLSAQAAINIKNPDDDQIFVIDTLPKMSVPKALKKTYPYGRDNPTALANPMGTGGVLLAVGAAVGFFWWLFRAKAETSSATPAQQPPLPPPPTPLQPPKVAQPAMPQLNCSGKVVLTYKLQDTPAPVTKLFRRLTYWDVNKTPDDKDAISNEETIWALPNVSSYFNVGAQTQPGGALEVTPLESLIKQVQAHYLSRRYFAEAWLETSDGWCLVATDTNYEPWTKTS